MGRDDAPVVYSSRGSGGLPPAGPTRSRHCPRHIPGTNPYSLYLRCALRGVIFVGPSLIWPVSERHYPDAFTPRFQPTVLKENLLMLWWLTFFIAIWLASSIIVPALWLLSVIESRLRVIRDNAPSAKQAIPDQLAISGGAG
jgi:hypothetical protein